MQGSYNTGKSALDSTGNFSHEQLATANPHKFSLLLDLDSTLISSLSLDSETKLVPDKLKSHFVKYKMAPYYDIFERPFLQEFLDYAFQNFNVSIMTAADKDYAIFIARNIILKNKPERKLNYFFYGYHSEVSEKIFDSPKDLRLLWNVFKVPGITRENTIIVDDNDLVYDANPQHTIRAPPFELLTENKRIKQSSRYDNWLLTLPFLLDSKIRVMKSGL